MSQDDHSPDEATAAEALARALDGEGGSSDLPDDALEIAALLRYSRDGGELPESRRTEILEELLDGVRPRTKVAQRRVGRRRWVLPSAGLATAAAAAAIAVLLMSPGLSVPVEATVLPRPQRALLEAQVSATRPGDRHADALDREMRGYRQDMYAALSQRYTGVER